MNYQEKILKIEEILGQVGIKNRVNFYETYELELAKFLESAPGLKRTISPEKYKAGAILALRNTNASTSLSQSQLAILAAAMEPSELLFGLYKNSPEQARSAAVYSVAGSSLTERENRAAGTQFLFSDDDWIAGFGEGHKTQREDFANEFIIYLAMMQEVQGLNEELLYRGKAVEPNNLTLGFLEPQTSSSGVTAVIDRYGEVLAAHRKMMRPAINYLFEEGTVVDQLSLAESGALGKKRGKAVFETYGEQKFGKKNAKVLKAAANIIGEDRAKASRPAKIVASERYVNGRKILAERTARAGRVKNQTR